MQIPTTFGDMSDEDLDAVFTELTDRTLDDSRTPSGWMRIWRDLVDSFSPLMSDTRPAGEVDGPNPAYKLLAVVLLLLATPVALLRNFLVLAMEAPFSNTAFILLASLSVSAWLLSTPELWQSSKTDSADGLFWQLASAVLVLLACITVGHHTPNSEPLAETTGIGGTAVGVTWPLVVQRP